MESASTIMATPNKLLDAALEYIDAGIRVIPLHHPILDARTSKVIACSCRLGTKCAEQTRGKHPLQNEWAKNAIIDAEAAIEQWERKPLANVGIMLGPESGIIDIEFDDDEGRKNANELMGECYTATYRSGRSVHRLFKWYADCPDVQKLIIRGLEIRIGGDNKSTQSVAPPSLHWSGVNYEWLPELSLSEIGIAEVPANVKQLIDENWLASVNGVDLSVPQAKTAEEWREAAAGSTEGKRNTKAATFVGGLLRSLRSLDDQSQINIAWGATQGWNLQNNPPLPDRELLATFQSVLKIEQRRRINEQSSLRRPPSLQAAEDQAVGVDDGWRLEIVQSDPPMYRLYSPLWADRTEGGYIILNKEQFCSPSRIKQEALGQAAYPLPVNFPRVWLGNPKEPNVPGMYERLVLSHEKADAPREQKRRQVVAQWLYNKLIRARIGTEPDLRGNPIKVEGKGIYFGFTAVWEGMAQSSDKITRPELSDIVTRIGCEDARATGSGTRVRLRLCTYQAMRALEQLIDLQDENLPTNSGASGQEVVNESDGED